MPVIDPDSGSQQLRRLLASVLTIGSDLDLHTVLHTIVAAAADLVSARYGALGVLDPTGTRLSDFITTGIDEETHARIGALPQGHGILGVLIIDPRPLRLPDLRLHPDSFGFPPNHPVMTSFLGVPIVVRGEVFGNLYLCDKTDGELFTDLDEELAVGLAAAAGVAIQNARLHARAAKSATIEDRDRIARDLHDTVIQRLFAVGLSLQSTLRLVHEPTVVSRLTAAVDDLDATVRDVRAAIFELHTPRVAGRSVRQELIKLCAESARGLGYDPVLRFDGPIDSALDDDVAEDVFAVVREALSNVAKHARAHSANVLVELHSGELTVKVLDDGIGPSREHLTGRGMANLRERAHARRGELSVAAREPSGTELTWTVHI
jgi:signal transduction histidine kinase